MPAHTARDGSGSLPMAGQCMNRRGRATKGSPGSQRVNA